jgi:hypothetical protein
VVRAHTQTPPLGPAFLLLLGVPTFRTPSHTHALSHLALPPSLSAPRRCCGDAQHFDLSYSAFDVIAQRDRGVVDLKVRPVSCDLQGQTIYYSSDGKKGG